MDEGKGAPREAEIIALGAANAAFALAQMCFFHAVDAGQIPRNTAVANLTASADQLRVLPHPSHQWTARALDDIVKRLKEAAN